MEAVMYWLVIITAVSVLGIFKSYECSILELMHPQMDLLSFDKCPDEGNGDIKIDGKQYRVNRTLIVESVNYTLKVPMDTSIKMEVNLDLWGNGGWRSNAYNVEIDDSCEALKKFLGEAATEMFGHFEPPFDKCPRQPGLYCEKDLDIGVFNKLKIPAYLPGLWRIRISYVRKKDKQRLGCYQRTLRVSTSKVFKNL